MREVSGSRHRVRRSTSTQAAHFLRFDPHQSHGLARMFGIVGGCDFFGDCWAVHDTENPLDDHCDVSRLFWRERRQKKLTENELRWSRLLGESVDCVYPSACHQSRLDQSHGVNLMLVEVCIRKRKGW